MSTSVNLQGKLLIGITTRTNNQSELNPVTAKIPGHIARYMKEKTAEQIPNRLAPHTTICAYTHATQGAHGDYTYFIGEEVTKIDQVPAGMEAIIIPHGLYQKYTAGPGPLPMIIIQTWQKIWLDSETTKEITRNFRVDFEVYDERAQNPLLAQVDIFVGIV